MEIRKLKFIAVADLHIADETMHDQNYRVGRFKKGFTRMAKEKDPAALLVSAGDLTDSGALTHWDTIRDLFRQYPPAPRLMLALGNHDLWTNEKDHPAGDDGAFARDTYIRYRNEISGCTAETAWFAETHGGVTFVCLAGERDASGMEIGETQLRWLEETLKNADTDHNPVFVVAHFPLNQTHGLPVTGGADPEQQTPYTDGIGAASDRVKEILRQCPNVFFLSGHLHMGFNGRRALKKKGYSSVENVEGITSVNLPCYSFLNHFGNPMWGYGAEFTVYGDRVEMRVKNYLYPLPGYRYTFSLT